MLERAFRWQNNKTSNFDSSLISLKSNQERPTPSSSPTRGNSITRRSISPDSPSVFTARSPLLAFLRLDASPISSRPSQGRNRISFQTHGRNTNLAISYKFTGILCIILTVAGTISFILVYFLFIFSANRSACSQLIITLSPRFSPRQRASWVAALEAWPAPDRMAGRRRRVYRVS